MRDPEKPRSFSARLKLIEETIPSMIIDALALGLLMRLLFEQEADRADDNGEMPLDVLVLDKIEEVLAEIDVDSADTGDWLRAQAAHAARDLLGLSGEMVDVEYEPDEPPTNDNGTG